MIRLIYSVATKSENKAKFIFFPIDLKNFDKRYLSETNSKVHTNSTASKKNSKLHKCRKPSFSMHTTLPAFSDAY